MTREEARKAAEVMLAYANGKEIETLRFEDYIPCENPSFNWVDGKGIKNYRIKPKPRYRPFKSQEECWNEMLKHQPFGWIIRDFDKEYINIVAINDNKSNKTLAVSIGPYGNLYFRFGYLFKAYKFADGTPFGIKEE